RDLTDRVTDRLKTDGVRARTVYVKLKLPDFRLVSRQVSRTSPTDDVETIFRAARSALEKSHVESRPVRLIGVGLSGLEHPEPDLQLTLQAAAHEPRVERVVAVLDEDRALGKTQEAAPRVFEFGGADEHRTVDVVALAGVRVDRRAAVDQGVKERQGPVESKALGPDLEDEEGSVAGRLDVEGYEL